MTSLHDVPCNRGGGGWIPWGRQREERLLREYGKGRHPAGLNIGDTCAYALARATGLSLLFKGDDFSKTDLEGIDLSS